MSSTFDVDDEVRLRMPSLWAWFKAGVGFTLGAGVTVSALWMVYMVGVLPFFVRGLLAAIR